MFQPLHMSTHIVLECGQLSAERERPHFMCSEDSVQLRIMCETRTLRVGGIFFFSPYIEWARVYSLSAHTPTNKSQFFFLSSSHSFSESINNETHLFCRSESEPKYFHFHFNSNSIAFSDIAHTNTI